MEWGVIVALVIAAPLILLPVAFIWYMNIGGIYAARKEARRREAAAKEEIRAVAGRDQS